MSKVKTDCFGYRSLHKECCVMQELICAKRKCSFYKTKAQNDMDMAKYPCVRPGKGTE